MVKFFKINRQLKLTVAFGVWLFFSSAFSQTTFDSTLANNLQNALDNVRTSQNMVGISAAVEMPDMEVWRGVSGMSNPTVNDSLHPETFFFLASISKIYTATLTLQLAEAGLLNLDDQLHQWLPTYANIDSTITIRQLLNHTSGIFDHLSHAGIFNAIFGNPNRVWLPEEILENFVLAPYFSPGNGWHYSNTNYILLGMIIEETTQSAYNVALQDHFLTPNDINNSFVAYFDSIPGDVAVNWIDLNGDGVLDNFSANFLSPSQSTIIWTAGGILATADDLAKMTRSLFKGQVLNQSTMDEMLTFVPSNIGSGYGLGVVRYFINGELMWGHGGNMPGFTTQTLYSPEHDFSISVLINENLANRTAVSSALATVLTNYLATGIASEANPVQHFELAQNYPNPFNPETTIEFDVVKNLPVTLKVYNLQGQEVATLVDKQLSPDHYKVVFNARDLASGVYFYHLQMGGVQGVKKMVLLK